MKKITITFLKPLASLIFVFSLIACSSQKNDNSAYISFNLGDKFEASKNVKSRAFDDNKIDLDSLTIQIRRQGFETDIAIIDLFNTTKTSIKVPSATPLNVIGEAFKNGVLQYRGEIRDVFLNPSERKQLSLPLGSTILIDIALDNTNSNSKKNKGFEFSNSNQFILFSSDANNLVENDSNEISDLFLRDINNNSTGFVNLNQNIDNPMTNISSTGVLNADISEDGLYIVFASGDESASHIYLKNRITQSITAISENFSETLLSNNNSHPQISDDGSVLTFYNSGSLNNEGQGIYHYNRLTKNLSFTIASSNRYQLSGDGLTVLFVNKNKNLNHYQLDSKILITIVTNIVEPRFRLSQNGKFIIFTDLNAHTDSTIEKNQVYRFVLGDNSFSQISIKNNGKKLSGVLDDLAPDISNDGNFVTFSLGNRIYIKDIIKNRLSNIAEGHSVFISADGKNLGYNYKNHLYIINNPLYIEQDEPNKKPTTPNAVTTKIANGNISVSWSEVSTANYYRIYQTHLVALENGGSSTVTEIYETTDLSLNINTVNDVIYSFSVSAINHDGESLTSEQILVTNTVDLINLKLNRTMPVNNEPEAPIDSIIEMVFSEIIDPNSVDNNTIELQSISEKLISGSFQFVESSIIFTPDQSLDYNQTYTLNINDGLKDLAGNTLEQTYQTIFTTVALKNEGSIEAPLEIPYKTYNGFVGLQRSYYSIVDLPIASDEIPFTWLENESVDISLQVADNLFNSESSFYNCENNVCTGYNGLKTAYLEINGENTLAGANYTIRSAVGKQIPNLNQSSISTVLQLINNNDKSYLLFDNLLPGTKYHISAALVNNVILDIRFLNENFKQCQLVDNANAKNLGCTSITDSLGNLIIEISGSNINGIFSSTLEVSQVIVEQFSENQFSFAGTFDKQYFEISGLASNTDYSISIQSSNFSPDDHIIRYYENNWNNINCEVQHFQNTDLAICETRSTANDEKIYFSISPPAHGDFSLATFSVTATPINGTLLTQGSFLGIPFPIQQTFIDVSPVRYYQTSELLPSIYAIALVNTTTALNTQLNLSVFNDEWLQPACTSISVSGLGEICLTDLTDTASPENKNLHVKLLDGFDLNRDSPPATADLNILPINIIDITDNLPYLQSPIGTGISEDLLVYKVGNLPDNIQIDVNFTLDSNFPVLNNFYVIASSLDKLLCTGVRLSEVTSACTTGSIINANEIYIVIDLRGLAVDTSYIIDVTTIFNQGL